MKRRKRGGKACQAGPKFGQKPTSCKGVQFSCRQPFNLQTHPLKLHFSLKIDACPLRIPGRRIVGSGSLGSESPRW